MKTTITKEEILEINGVTGLSEWKDRLYINLQGKVVSKLWLDKQGKIHFEIGKGTNSTESNETIERILGCDISDRYRLKADYIIL
jgi:hypothetical protein